MNYLKTVEKYNPETNKWTCVASMGARRGGVGVATLGGCLYATGGYDGTSNLNTSGKSAHLNSLNSGFDTKYSCEVRKLLASCASAR